MQKELSLFIDILHEDGKMTCLFEYVKTFEEADLLAQYSMLTKKPRDLVVIMPGWNRGIDKDPEVFEKAKLLSEKYKAEVRKK